MSGPDADFVLNQPLFFLPTTEQLGLNISTGASMEYATTEAFSNLMGLGNGTQLCVLDNGQLALQLPRGLQGVLVGMQSTDDGKDDNSTETSEQLTSFGEEVVPSNMIYTLGDTTDLQQTRHGTLADWEEACSVSDCDEHPEITFVNSLVDVITTYKCRLCSFDAATHKALLEHLKKRHVNIETLQQSGDCLKPFSSASTDFVPENESINAAEKLVFLCAQCAEPYDSLDDCRKHMVEDHRLVSEEQDQSSCSANKLENNHNESSEKTDAQNKDTATLTVPNDTASSADLVTVNIGPRRGQRKRKLPQSLAGIFHLEGSFSRFKCHSIGCSVKFISERDLDLHDLCHNTEAHDFRCLECGHQFDKWRLCRVHLWLEHQIDVGMLSCSQCSYKTSTRLKLNRHVKIHSNARQFTCSVCQKKFKQLSQLKNHSVVHMDRKSALTVPKWYTARDCPVCRKTFADTKCLKKHLVAVHGKIKPYSCPVCGHTCARKAMLQLHLRQHTGEKPYSCEVCSFKTGDHNSLRRHKMRHTGQRQYKCPYCDYSSIQSAGYKNHLKRKHPSAGSLFECKTCHFCCVKEEAYLLHMMEHVRDDKTQKTTHEKENGLPGSTVVSNSEQDSSESSSEMVENSLRTFKTKHVPIKGTSQTITIQIPVNMEFPEVDDGCIRVEDLVQQRPADEPDMGGITIPADPCPCPVLQLGEGQHSTELVTKDTHVYKQLFHR